MKIEIRSESFDPWQEIVDYQRSATDMQGKYGATAVFVASMRDLNEGDRVLSMTLEHYPGMTETHLRKIGERAREKWDIQDTMMLHRTGVVHPSDPIVLVVVWSAHRAAAYEANRFIMENLKSKAPFWKKETLDSGERWVEKNTPG